MEVGLTHFFTALGSGGTATLLTIATQFYLNLRKARQEEGATQSTIVTSEWSKTSEEWSKLVNRLSDQTSVLQSQIATLIKENNRWQVENEFLRGELRVREHVIKQLRSGMPATASEGIIVVDEHFNIVRVNSAAALLFHYAEEDIIDQPSIVLVPVRYRTQHLAGLQRVKDTGKMPDSTRVLQVYGLTREGDEIPVDIQLTSWQSGGHWFYGAAIRRRTERMQPPAAIAPEVTPKLVEMKAMAEIERGPNDTKV
jgi:PAS domain S-box-containing protein